MTIIVARKTIAKKEILVLVYKDLLGGTSLMNSFLWEESDLCWSSFPFLLLLSLLMDPLRIFA
jgi:hypothetical protein